MVGEYDIEQIFERIENELIDSMMRNFARHRAEEDQMGIDWSMWQAEMLQTLEAWKKANAKKYPGQFAEVNKRIETLLRKTYGDSQMDQEREILEAIRDGFLTQNQFSGAAEGSFFRANERKLEALIKSVTSDFEKAETAILRRANDQYRQIIYAAQVYANTGAGSYEQAVDMATKDFLARGIDCIEYKNGARHNIRDYSRMAIRTANKRAQLQGEGDKRAEWGISTVLVHKRGNPCPKCLPFVGKVLVDDVWSGGRKDGKSSVTEVKYPLMSTAIAAGLYHPNCKDGHSTYYEGVSDPPDDRYTRDELDTLAEKYQKEQKALHAMRQAVKYARLAKYSLDPENQRKYATRAEEWVAEKEKYFRNAQFRTGDADTTEYIKNRDLVPKGFDDVTAAWLEKATPNSHQVKDKFEYQVDGITYKVDGDRVVLDYSEKEKRVAELLENTLGGEIYMIPRVLSPQGISTPDYVFRGERFDLKELTGTSKNLVYNAISKKKRQAENFILDISNCLFDEAEIKKQLEGIYQSNHTIFVDKIIIIKNNAIVSIFCRKK